MTEPNTARSSIVKAGSHVGPYRVESAIGSGGMADVFYAIHKDLQRPAAIKVLKASLADDETSLQRFLNEARSAAQLVHSNIVQVYDVGRDGDIHFIAQEFIAGTNLRQFLAPTPSEDDRQPSTDEANEDDRQLPLPEALSILLQVLAALEKSAARGIVHRDIKPENIMLTADGVVKVTDFGLARTYLGDDPKLTRAGTTLGTPMYMSPEQIQDGAVDIRSDLYSLGVTLYHMLAGRPPFKGETQLALAMMHTQADVPDIRRFRRDIPESLCELLDRLLQKDPESRLPTPAAVIEFLRQHRSGDLAAFWPEHTLPLPHAGNLAPLPAMQATIALQTELSRQNSGWSSTITDGAQRLSGLVGAIVILAAFAIGLIANLKAPMEGAQSDDLYRGVPRMASAEAQYHWALVNENIRASREDKWRAVQFYFPKGSPGDSGDSSARLYAGQASIQLARALHRKGDSESALAELQPTLSDPFMDKFTLVHAYMVRAMILEDQMGEQDDPTEVIEAVESALEIWRSAYELEDRREELELQIDDLVDSQGGDRTRQAWKNGKT